MLHFHMTNGVVDAASELSSADHHQISETGQWLPRGFSATKGISEKASGWFNRWEIDSFSTAEAIAEALNIAAVAKGKDGATWYTAADSGPGVSPRFDVVRAPRVGDEVSGYFNGDSYPEGKIIRVSTSLRRVQTSSGAVFYRQGASARWVRRGTWAMIHGHHNDRNPHL